MSGAWRGFDDELARWRDAGRVAEFWWRDDDAARPAPALSQLVALSARTSVPLALAVVPLEAAGEAFEGLAGTVSVIQHGTDHRNRAAPGGKKTEYPAGETLDAAIDRLAAARARLGELAGSRVLPVLAPPWNRLRAELAGRLADAGLRGLSQYGARTCALAAPGVVQVNTHVDLIDWRGGRGFAGDDAVLAAAVRHLAAKRQAAADALEPTGWLTHHAVHDGPCWSFLERLFETTRALPWVRWHKPQELFHIP